MSTARNYIRANKTLFVTLLLVLSLGIANAATTFTNAPGNPPSNNTAQPLDVSATAQTKLGKITVGDATTQGTNMLDVQGRIKMVDGNQAAGKVLTSDATGLATWQPVSAATATGVDGPSFSAYRTAATGLSLPAGETVIAFDTVTAPTALNNTDPCIASACPGGPWGYRTSDNTFKPSVPGRYLLSASARIWVAANFQAEVRLYKNSSLIKQAVLQDVGSQVYETLTVTAVVDSAAGDTFSLRVYNPTTAGQVYLYGDVNGRQTFFTGSRVGNPATVVEGNTYTQPDIIVPSKAVMYFNDTTCPTGWTVFTQLQGKYAVGTPSGGALLGGAGTALTNNENRPTGAHTHQYYWYDHLHSYSGSVYVPVTVTGSGTVYNGSTGVVHRAYGGNDWNIADPGPISVGFSGSGSGTGSYSGNTSYSGIASQYFATTGVVGGAVAGTNAPYVQLLACQKN